MDDLAQHTLVDVDHLPCGCLITTQGTRITFANQYFKRALNWKIEALAGQRIDILFSKSTLLFFESYITPTVLHEGQCCEVQVSLLNSDGAAIPKVASVRRLPDGNLIWVFLEAENRTQLFHELETAREVLQEQREQLEVLAQTDPLTGLANRRDFEKIGREILARARRSGSPVSVLMLDVDHFKALNDTYGHDAGDRALRILADVLRSHCRESDLVARLGGDEFACLMGDTDLVGAKALYDRIRIAVEQTGDLGFTVSIGVAELPGHSQIDLFELVKQADEALYLAKRTRPNLTQTMGATEPKWSVGG